jgi:hypothetical protein
MHINIGKWAQAIRVSVCGMRSKSQGMLVGWSVTGRKIQVLIVECRLNGGVYDCMAIRIRHHAP